MKLEKFLCFKIETGGVIIGYFGIFQNILAIFGALMIIVLAMIGNCDLLRKYLNDAQFDEFNTVCSSGRLVIIVTYGLVSVLCMAFAIISYLCVQATKSLKHLQLLPMMAFLVFCIFGSLRSVIYGSWIGLIYGAFHTYSLLVLYSLFEKFRCREQSATIQYHQPGEKV